LSVTNNSNRAGSVTKERAIKCWILDTIVYNLNKLTLNSLSLRAMAKQFQKITSSLSPFTMTGFYFPAGIKNLLAMGCDPGGGVTVRVLFLSLVVMIAVSMCCEVTVCALEVPDVLEAYAGEEGSVWERVNQPGFGSDYNMSVVAMAEYGERLYAMTRNEVEGAEVWRTSDTGWEQVFFPDSETNGIYGNTWINNVWGAMKVFQGKLYFGFSSGLQGSVLKSTGCEIWRYDGENWEPVISDKKDTEESGTITAISGCEEDDGDIMAQITDNSKSWTEDEWAGGVLQITSGGGKYRRFDIISNTADTLTVQQNEEAGDGGTEYTVCESKPYSNPFPPYSYDLGAVEVDDSYKIGTDDDENGFGDYWNKTITKMCVYNAKLYVSTGLNYDYGGQVWYTEDGDNWTVTQPANSFGNFHTDPKYPNSKKPVSTSISSLCTSSVSGSEVLYAGGAGSSGDKSLVNLGACSRMAKLTATGWELIVDTNVDDNDTGTNENGFGDGMECTLQSGNFLPWCLTSFDNKLIAGIQSLGGARVLYSTNGSSEDGSWFYSVGGDGLLPAGFDGEVNGGIPTMYQNVAVNLSTFENYLYAGLVSTFAPAMGATKEYLTGSLIWKTSDGINWQQVTGDGFGDDYVVGFEAFTTFANALYVSASKGASSSIEGLGGASILRLVSDAADDYDEDGIINITDNCPVIANADQTDSDLDGSGDACDSFPNSYPPLPEALDAMESGSAVTVREVVVEEWEENSNFYYAFEPKQEVPTVGFIIYPGGLLDPRAYAPPAHTIAAEGYLVIIVKMPDDLAFLSPKRANRVMSDYDEIETWVIGGHSLGGSFSCAYAKEFTDKVDGVVLWASWPSEGFRLDDTELKAISIYGTNDGHPEEIEAGAEHLPAGAKFVKIEGGNHTQFGYYDTSPFPYQEGDNPADRSREAQQEEIIQATVVFLGSFSVDFYDQGPFPVQVIYVPDISAPVTLDIYTPSDSDTYPVIIFQHGFTGSIKNYETISTYLASHGFVVVLPQMYPPGDSGSAPTLEEEADLGVQIISWIEGNINSHIPVVADTSLLGLAGHSRGGQIAYRMALDDDTTGKVKALAGVDPVDGIEMFGQTLAVTGPLTFDIPTYILGTGLGPIVVDDFLACAPEEVGPLHFYCNSPNPTWLVMATTHGHADMIDEEDFEEFCPGGPDRDGMRALTGGTLAAFFSGILQGNESALSVLSDSGSAPVPTEMEMNRMGGACADVTLEPGDVYYNPFHNPSDEEAVVKKPMCLDNQELVGGIQFDLCEYDLASDPIDCMECIDCELTERTTMFDCEVVELGNGCCRVLLFCKNPGCAINPGLCDIVTVVYQAFPISEECPGDECIIQMPENIVASDYDGYQLSAVGFPGTVCPIVCGDVCPAGTPPGWDCGDGVVDIYDIMCEVDFALTDDPMSAPNPCQLPRANVPTGTPPDCQDPDDTINILDIMVLIDMALGRQDCCTFYYTGVMY